MTMSPGVRCGSTSSRVASTAAAGTINHTARGVSRPPVASRASSRDRQPTPRQLRWLDQLLDRLGGSVEHHALMTTGQQPMDHVGAHTAESDHSELHSLLTGSFTTHVFDASKML